MLNRFGLLSQKQRIFGEEHSGILSQRDIRLIQNFIKKNYKEMYLTWRELSDQDFYGKEEG